MRQFEGVLRERVEKYYAGWKPQIMWQLSSKDFKGDTTEQEYIEYSEQNNCMKEFTDVTFSVEDVTIMGTKARVQLRSRGKVIVTGGLF